MGIPPKLCPVRPVESALSFSGEGRDELPESVALELVEVELEAPNGLELVPLALELANGGDWHPSNLTWTERVSAAVAGVFDFGLADRTLAVHDLATALKADAVSWLDLAESGRAAADLAAVDALLNGYHAVPAGSGPSKAAALAGVLLRVVHVEYALAEIEYFTTWSAAPGRADLAYDGYLLGPLPQTPKR